MSPPPAEAPETGRGRAWRLLHTWDAEPGFNMALDETLLEDPEAPPTLRFYTWSPDTVSLGYFQPFGDVPGLQRAGAVVRRLTGGGAIHHTGELTFSLATDASDPLYRGPVAGSYERVHRALAGVLAQLGVHAELRVAAQLASDRRGTGMCFHVSTPLDLVWDDRKGIGSAQRRKGGRVLHHGSIKLAAAGLDVGVAALRDYRAGLEPAELAELLVAELPARLGLCLVPGELSPSELERARTRGPFYLSEAFLQRR